MKSFGKYITKYFASFAIFIVVLLVTNILVFIFFFQGIMKRNYGETSPRNLLEQTASASTKEGMGEEMMEYLHQQGIWVMLLDQKGQILWSVDLPEEIPVSYSIQDVAVFSKGYLKDYPVFIWSLEDGLLVLGYPKGSYTKLTGNYYPVSILKMFPAFILLLCVVDLLLFFGVYFLSKHKILKNVAPIVSAMEALSHGKQVSLSIRGELSEVADGLNRASQLLSRQSEARANWISGVSHDIRTPLSMIMGYAGRIEADDTTSGPVREQAGIIRMQSVKIKELVQDLNLVSRLEYEMQPIQKSSVHIARLLRTFAAQLLNSGIPEQDSIEVVVEKEAEGLLLDCDERLITRAIANLVQNSINHNPVGCDIKLLMKCTDTEISIEVSDNGAGISPVKLKELENKPHYMESTDDTLNLRHGLGLLLVGQIMQAHKGAMEMENIREGGLKTTLRFIRSK